MRTAGTLYLLEMTVLATAIAGLLYFSYFQLAPWIWAQSLPFSSEQTLPWIRPWVAERDGIELYALYVLMFLDLLCIYALSRLWDRLAEHPVRYLIAVPLVATALMFIASLGFHPPMSNISERALPDILGAALEVIAVVLPIIVVLYILQQRSPGWVLPAVSLLLFPVCFIATSPIEWYDYQYILAPALRLFHGAAIADIYFQYDLLFSLLGWAWMEVGLEINSFQVVAQTFYYLLLMGLFAFSRHWFADKRLAVFLLVALVLVRIYPGMFDAAHSIQTTPLRLDLWFVLLALVYFKGAHHWSAGLFCGLMLLLHHNFGIIYSAAYIQLLLTLSVIDMRLITGRKLAGITTALTGTLRKNSAGLVFMLAGFVMHYLLFRNPDIPGEFSFQNLGIGFLQIATDSFYWYVLMLTGLTFLLLIRLRTILSTNYFAAGFFLIYLAIGNSLYFFGRSHENNIINIAAVLLLMFFLLLDLVGSFLAERSLHDASGVPAKIFMRRNGMIIAALAFIASIAVWYGDSITVKAGIQVRNAFANQFIYPSEITQEALLPVIEKVRAIAGDDRKVYFVGDNDFLLDYYGGYAPVGYYNPVYAWISKREFIMFMQGLLDQGYYLVVDNGIARELLASAHFANSVNIGGRWMVWK